MTAQQARLSAYPPADTTGAAGRNFAARLYRYPPGWDTLTSDTSDTAEKTRLTALASEFRQYWTQNQPLITASIQSRDSVLAESLRESRRLRLTLTKRLLAGSGLPTPFDVGLDLDPILGIPRVMGSTLKGLARSTAGVPTDPTRTDRPAATDDEALFGTQQTQGALVFSDALLVELPRKQQADTLILQTQTPHESTYYSGSPDAIPGGFENPKPFSYLVVPAGAVLGTVVGIRHGTLGAGLDRRSPSDLLDEAIGLLREGLGLLGIAAKTSSGYGRAMIEVL